MHSTDTRTADDVKPFYSLLQRILALIPGLSYRSAHYNADRAEVDFDPRCGGLIERYWPEVFGLCKECGCHAHFEWQDGVVMRSVLDTESAAPIYTAEPVSSVKLQITAVAEQKEAA
jgi:hypothetical protein